MVSAEGVEGDAAAAYLCIPFPHKLSALAQAMLAHPNILAVLTRLIGPNVKCIQSMLFIKQEAIVAAIGVGLQDTDEGLEMPLGMFARAVARGVMKRRRRILTLPATAFIAAAVYGAVVVLA